MTTLREQIDEVYTELLDVNALAGTPGVMKSLSAVLDAAAQWDALREPLQRFATLMEETLRKHDDRGGWENCREVWLLQRLREETLELEDAMGRGQSSVPSEAADVANFAMMIADNSGWLSGALPPVPGEDR